MDRVVVEGVNIRKRHTRPKKQGEKGQIIEIEAPMHISNIMLICTKCDSPTRIGSKIHKEGKNRVCKRCEATV